MRGIQVFLYTIPERSSRLPFWGYIAWGVQLWCKELGRPPPDPPSQLDDERLREPGKRIVEGG